jgi:CRP-like cAMP-binding protein
MNPPEKPQKAGWKSRRAQQHPSHEAAPALPPDVAPVFDSRTPRPKPLDLFEELQPAERDAFLAKCTRQHFSVGTSIFSQGEPYTKSHLIRSGVVRTYYVAPSGKEITIAYWPEGTLVGGPNVFREQRPHIWSAQATTEVVTEQIRGQDLEELSMRIPRLAHYLIETLTFKLHWVSVLLQTFGTQSVRARVAHLLLQLGERYGVEHPQGTLITQHFSHEELGRMVGATRSWVTLALKQLKSDGIITTRGRDILILSMNGLRGTPQGRGSDSSKRSPGTRSDQKGI